MHIYHQVNADNEFALIQSDSGPEITRTHVQVFEAKFQTSNLTDVYMYTNRTITRRKKKLLNQQMSSAGIETAVFFL